MTKRFFKMLVCLIALTAVALSAVACDLIKGDSSGSSDSSGASGSSASSDNSSSSGSSDSSDSSGGSGSSGEVHEHKFKIIKDEKTDNTLCIVSYECECGKQSDAKIEVVIIRYVKTESSRTAVKTEERYKADDDGKVRLLKTSLYSSDVEKAYAVNAVDGKNIGLVSGWSDFY